MHSYLDDTNLPSLDNIKVIIFGHTMLVPVFKVLSGCQFKGLDIMFQDTEHQTAMLLLICWYVEADMLRLEL